MIADRDRIVIDRTKSRRVDPVELAAIIGLIAGLGVSGIIWAVLG